MITTQGKTYNLTRAVQETVIRWDATPDKATIYTATPDAIRKLDKLVEAYPDTYKRVWGDKKFKAKRYEVDKKCVNMRKPPSPAQREAAR